MGTPSQSYGTSLAIWDYSVTCHPTQVNAPRLTPAMQDGTRKSISFHADRTFKPQSLEKINSETTEEVGKKNSTCIIIMHAGLFFTEGDHSKSELITVFKVYLNMYV